MRRNTKEQYYELAEQRGLRWVGEYPENTHTNTQWECPEGHQWEARYNNIQRHGCPVCANINTRRITEAQYHARAVERGFKWVGEYPKNTRDKTLWECQQGHQWSARYSDVSTGGCPYCLRITKEQYYELARKLGFRFVGEYPKNCATKTLWACRQGHQWKASYTGVTGCPHCSRQARITKTSYRAIANERGFKWVGEFPRNTGTKTMWECALGHRWPACYKDIYHKDSGCPYCAGKAPRTEADYYRLAEQRGLKFVGEYPKNTKAKTAWECVHGHQWESSYNNVLQCGCPRCACYINGARASKAQIEIAGLLSAKVNHRVGARYVDCAILDNKVAIEYDCWFWHAGHEKRDYERAQELINDGWCVIAVKANTQLPTLEQLEECIAQLNEDRPYIELILDWGSGPLAKDVLGSGK